MKFHNLLAGFAVLAMTLGTDAASAGDNLAGNYVTSWQGVYIGAHAGWADGDSDWTHLNGNPYTNALAFDPIAYPGDSYSADGAIAGMQIGYNRQRGRFVIGGEISYTGTGDRLSGSNVLPDTVFAVGTTESKVDGMFGVFARLGYTFRDGYLLYAKGGYVGGDIETAGIGQDPSISFRTREWHNGFGIGGGLEVKLHDRVSMAIEYLHIDLGDKEHVGLAPGYLDFPVRHDVDADINSITVRLNLQLTQ